MDTNSNPGVADHERVQPPRLSWVPPVGVHRAAKPPVLRVLRHNRLPTAEHLRISDMSNEAAHWRPNRKWDVRVLVQELRDPVDQLLDESSRGFIFSDGLSA